MACFGARSWQSGRSGFLRAHGEWVSRKAQHPDGWVHFRRRALTPVSVGELLDAGMHYGHHVSSWNPKMKPYIFVLRNLIHIINLRETLRGVVTAMRFVTHVVALGKTVV